MYVTNLALKLAILAEFKSCVWKSVVKFEKSNRNWQILLHGHKHSQNLQKPLEIVFSHNKPCGNNKVNLAVNDMSNNSKYCFCYQKKSVKMCHKKSTLKEIWSH